MAENENKVRVQVMLSPAILARIDDLANLLGGTRSGVAAALVEQALEDDEWIVRHIAVPVRNMLKRWGVVKTSKALRTE